MCLFCEIQNNKNEFIYENPYFFVIRDHFPVSRGHSLIIPKRHVQNFFELTEEELPFFHDALKETKHNIDEHFHPDGLNIGINQGSAAGQTIMHLHIHVIPRYIGDVESPRGGIRGVIPGKQSY